MAGRTDYVGIGGITVAVNPAAFDAGLALAKALGGTYDHDSKEWYIPERNAGRVPFPTAGQPPPLLYRHTDGTASPSYWHPLNCACDRCAGLVADHGEGCNCTPCKRERGGIYHPGTGEVVPWNPATGAAVGVA